MATWHSVSRQVATPERTSAAQTPKSAAAPRPSPAQLLQQRLGNQGTAAFLSQNVLQVSSQLDSPTNQVHAVAPSGASSMDLSASGAPVGSGASVLSAPPRQSQQETAPSAHEAGQATTTSTPVPGLLGKSDASQQRADRTKEAGLAPTREASAQATPVAQQRAGTKSGESSKAAVAQAEPVAPTQAEPRGEKGPKLTSPSAREALAPVAATLHHRAAKARKHSAPRIPVASAQAAAIRPATERTRAAAIQTVANLDAAKDKTGQFNKNEFRERLKSAIDATMQKPKTESEAKEVMKAGAKNASGLLKGEVTTQNQAVSGELQSATTDVRVSDQPEMKEVGLTPEPLGAPPAPVTTEAAVPPPLPAEQLDYSSDRAPTDKAMADAGVTKEQLEQGNEPEFKTNLAARTDAEKHEAGAEQSYRKTEVGIREQTEHSAQTVVSHGLTNIHSARAAKIGKVVDQQNVTREKHAAEHQRITDEINKIKNETRKDVNDVLTAMEKEGGDIFEKGLSDAEKAYEATFKEEKGGTWTWLTTWGSDWEDLIERSLATARGIYRVTVYQAIDRVADFVDAKLEEAKRKVSEGRSKVKSFVKGLDDSVRGFGETALKAVSADFDQMSGEIDQRRDSLVNKLTEQYKASYERMSAMEEKLREENKSLWQRIYDATVGLIKKILAFKDMLLNVLARAADAIGSIIAHPISFLGNLVDAGKLGFSNFVDHIGEHLKQGFMEWLFGAVAETGIQLPKNFDLAGILSLVLQVLGLTYSNIRSRAVKILGEKVVKALETTAEIFKILITKGPAGLWEYIKEKLGDLKAMVIDKIKSFIMEKVIMAGVTWIIGLLNPASAFFKACKAIYDIVMFFVSHGEQILALVNAIIDSISSIAKGAIGAAAAWVEKTLARTIPVIIGFLAALLGVGGISEKIREIIEAIRKPINEAIDWVITKAVDLVKAAGGLLGFGKAEDKKDSHEQLEGAQLAAQNAVHLKLGADTTPETAEAALPGILQELAPTGLKNLILGPPDEEGDREVLAEASPRKRVAKLMHKRISVAVSATIRVKEGKEVMAGLFRGPSVERLRSGTLQQWPGEEPKFAEFRSYQKEALGGTGRAAMLQPVSQPPGTRAKSGDQPSGGLIVEPKPGASELEILTWNTSQPERGHNVSHAERQFIDWFRQRPRAWREKVESVTLVVEGRPVCDRCEVDLLQLQEDFDWIKFSWTGDKKKEDKTMKVE